MKTINTVNEYNDIIKQIKTDWKIAERKKLWFRGQQQNLNLLPKVYRKITIKETEYSYNEAYIKNAFDSLYKNYYHKMTGNVVKYSLMQHYGIPTRLLDFTESSLAALFFSVENWQDSDQGYVYILNPGYLNDLTDGSGDRGPYLGSIELVNGRIDVIGHDFSNPRFLEKYPQYGPIDLNLPIAFYPESENNNRILAQKGVFVLWGVHKLSLQEILNRGLGLEIIQINNSHSIYNELNTMGITERTIYPDLFGLSKELNSYEFLIKS